MATINGDPTNLALTGTEEDDAFRPFPGSTITGNGGFDTLDYSGPPDGALPVPPNPALPITVNLRTGTTTYGGAFAATTDSFSGISGVIGSADGDTIIGADGDERLSGEGGDDTIIGNGGDDQLRGGGGSNVLDGRDGRDTVDLGSAGFRGGVLTRNGADLINTRGTEVDTYRSVEELRFLDGRLVLDPNDPAAQVVRLYQAILGRDPDQAGLNFWIERFQQGALFTDLASDFLDTPEADARFGGLDDAGFVDRLYENVLGRPGEQDGRAFWIEQLQQGANREDVLIAFSESDENREGTQDEVDAGIWDRNETAQQVARLYDTTFGRLPDRAGLTYWTSEIQGGSTDLAAAANDFASSPEFASRYGQLGNETFVQTLYQNTLGRRGDAAGVNFWTDELDNGNLTRSDVVLGFSESAEHAARTAPQLGGEDPSQYGIVIAG